MCRVSSAGGLTQRKIKSLRPRAGAQYVVWDGVLPGFGVRVGQEARTYILKYRLTTGRVRWATLGRVGDVPLTKARKRARRYVGVVADGGDPLRVKDDARNAPTFGDVADRFLAEHVAARRKPATQRLYKLAIDGHLRPRFGPAPIVDLCTADLLKVQHRLRATPYMANRVIAVASKLMNWAAQHDYRDPHTNPCDGIEKFKEDARARYLSPAELLRLGAALRVAVRYGSLSPAAIAALRLLLFTGARVGEILSLRWREVDLAGGALHLADSKTGAKTILLNAPAIDVLRAWPRVVGSRYVFPGEGRGKRKGQHRVSLVDAWAWIRKRARLHDVRVHDLRHSFASIGVSNGQTLPVIGALLGHSQAATTQRYAHLMADPLRAASAATGATIAAALERRRRA
jgi:integrase